jgi:hypothetical protein
MPGLAVLASWQRLGSAREFDKKSLADPGFGGAKIVLFRRTQEMRHTKIKFRKHFARLDFEM